MLFKVEFTYRPLDTSHDTQSIDLFSAKSSIYFSNRLTNERIFQTASVSPTGRRAKSEVSGEKLLDMPQNQRFRVIFPFTELFDAM